jgi:tyrosine-protein phosphatase SIW14
MAQRWQWILTASLVAVLVGVPLIYSSHRQTDLRNFRIVEDGVLYRSGQLSQSAFDRVLNEYQIKTVVTLRTARNPADPHPDAWEKQICDARGLRHVRLVPKVWGEDEKGEIPADDNVQKFLELMRDRKNHPVLVHCFAGIHRTGTMVGLYRMEFDRWSVDRAIAEMQLYGFAPEDMHEHIEVYLRSFRPSWKAAAAE